MVNISIENVILIHKYMLNIVDLIDRYISIRLSGTLTLCEVEVFAIQ